MNSPNGAVPGPPTPDGAIPQIVWTAGPDGRIDPESRQRAERADAALGPMIEAWTRAIRAGRPGEFEHRVRGADGSDRWMLARASPLRDEEGRVVRWVGTATDIDERKREWERLRHQAESFRVTLSSIGDAVLVAGADGRITFLNAVAGALTGWHGQAVGRPMGEVFAILHETTRLPAEDPVAKVLREGKVVGLANHTILVARDGRETPIDDSAAPIRDDDGSIRGVVLVFRDVTARREAERADAERVRLATFAGAVGLALTEHHDLAETLRRCAEAMVGHLDAAFARIWTVSEDGLILELRSSAGLYTHLDGPHGRVPVGRFKIGRIALDREPHLTNDVRNDPRVGDRDWARREGMVAFAGYPLEVDGRLVGVMAMFARHPLTGATLEAMATTARGIALGIDRKRIEEERARLLESERELRTKAEAVGRAKDQFLAMLSHELRTPLTPILLTASSRLEAPETPEAIRPVWEMIRRNIGLEIRLIDDLLDVMRTISGKMPYHFEFVDAHELIRRSIEIVAGDVAERRIGLTSRLEAERTRVRADPARLTQALWNLLKNAVKFTPEGGSIEVRTRDQGRRLAIEISDTGIGIDPEALPRIFNAFEQVEDSVTRRFGGLGLGLAIAKSVVDSHGGALRASSPGRGAGATFTIELDAATASAERGPAAAPGVASRGSYAILLVEDDAMTCRIMATLLRNAGHSVTTATTYDEAIELASPGFDLVVSDVRLPGRSGFDLMGTLKAAHGLRGIALTGLGRDDDIRKGREAGFVAHMTKPVDFARLEEVIQRVGSAGRD